MNVVQLSSITRKPVLALLLGSVAAAWFGNFNTAKADYASAVLAKSPVGYWRLNDAVAAPANVLATNIGTLGAAGNGTFENDILAGVAGALPAQSATNFAIRGEEYLEGNRVRVPFQPVFNTNGSFTVEFWCKPGQTNTLTCPVASTEFADPSTNQAVRRGWLFYQGVLDPDSGNGWVFRIYNPPSGATPQQINCAVTNQLNTNLWYHIAGTYKANNPNKGLTLYVNGVSVATASVSKNYEPVVTNTIPLTMGARADGDFGFFTYVGSIDEVAFYPFLLTSAQILGHYQAGTNAVTGTNYQSVILGQAPAGYWHLNEKLGPPAANLGSSAAAGQYLYASAPGVAGPQPPTFMGFEATNRAVQIQTNNPGSVRTAPLAINTNTVTMTAWIKPNGPQFPYTGIFMHATALDGTYAGISIGKDGGLEIGYTWNDDASTYDFPTTVTVPDGQWSFVAVTVGPTQAVIYAHDGTTFQTNVNLVPHPVQGFNGLSRIGMDYIYAPDTVFNGVVDEVAIFKSTFSAGDVYTLYAAGKGGVSPAIFGDVVAPTGLSAGDTLFLSVDAGGTPTLAYRWQKNGTNLAGATGTSYTKANLAIADEGDYRVVITNAYGAVTSSVATISIQSQTQPVITDQPASATVYKGGYANLQVGATGGGLKYRWFQNSSLLGSATNASVVFSPVDPTNAGNYFVIVSNTVGSATSLTATVTVVVPAAGTYAATVLADSPISWWRLDEPPGSPTFQDAMGRNPGTWATPPTLGVPGVAGTNTAAYFPDGARAYGDVPFSFDLNTATITVECWVKTTNVTETLCPVGSWAATPHLKGYMFIKEFGEWQSAFSFGDDFIYTYIPLGDLPLDRSERWAHLVFTSSPSDGWSGYYNGVRTAGPFSSTGWLLNGTYPFEIGVNVPGASDYNNFFDGTIDEVAVYPTVLSDQQIQNHYQTALYGTNSPPVFLTQPASQTVSEGNPVTFSSHVEGSLPITLQWLRNGSPIAGETNGSLTIASVTFSNAATYWLAATNLVAVAGTNSLPATLTVLSQPTYANVTNGLVLHLNFDGNYLDTSGHGNHGYPSNSPAIVPGKVGSGALSYATVQIVDTNALTTNYISSFVNLGIRPDLQFGTATDFSIAFWVKFTGTPGDLPFFNNTANALSSAGYTFAPSYGAGGIGWSLNDYLFESGQTINDGTWHHVVVAIQRTGLAVTYLDGQAIDTRFGTSTSLDTAFPTVIGQSGVFTYPEAGAFQLDDLGVWRRSLTSSEAYSIWYVGQTYGRSFDTFGPVLLVIRPSGPNLELLWQSGTLQQATNLSGPWTNVAGATAPRQVISPTNLRRFYRVQL
jgi:hypothetical protein